VLKEWIREWRNREYNESMPADPYLFPNGAEGPMNSDALAKAFRRYCNERQVKRASLHGLRHSYARLMVKNGSDSFKLQRMLNHSTLDMTRKYVKLFAEDIKEGYDAISPLDNMVKKTGKTIQRSK
jgi:integrase/recombinase XerD